MRTNPLVRLGAVAALAAGMLMAQAPAPQSGQNQQRPKAAGRQMRGGMHGDGGLWAAALDLTDAQKTQAKAIFQESRDEAKPVMQEMRTAHQALQAAIKTPGSDLDTLAANQGAIMAKLIALQAKASQKFYALLTPAQQQKFDTLHGGMRGPLGGGFGPGMMMQ